MRKLLMAVAVYCALTTGAHSQPQVQQGICATPKDQANHSPLCVRWYFACQANLGARPTSGVATNLSEAVRVRLIIALTFRLAELNCDQFNYPEALAAMQAHIFAFESSASK